MKSLRENGLINNDSWLADEANLAVAMSDYENALAPIELLYSRYPNNHNILEKYLIVLDKIESYEKIKEVTESIDLKSICQLIIKKERKIKAFFADNKSVYAQNFVQKSWGKVLFSLFFDFNEAMSVIMAIKFGVELKIISLSQDINFVSLIYQIKDHHIDYLLDNYDFSFEEEIADNHKMKIQRLRAVILQQSFEKIKLKG